MGLLAQKVFGTSIDFYTKLFYTNWRIFAFDSRWDLECCSLLSIVSGIWKADFKSLTTQNTHRIKQCQWRIYDLKSHIIIPFILQVFTYLNQAMPMVPFILQVFTYLKSIFDMCYSALTKENNAITIAKNNIQYFIMVQLNPCQSNRVEMKK